MQSALKHFFKDAFQTVMKGSRTYYLWLLILILFITLGVGAYVIQLDKGLVVTNMNDYVSWGLYISNFTFLVGLAAAAVMLVLPTYILKDLEFSKAVLIGEGVAVSALIMCLCFVVADMGGPHKLWHMLPVVGYFNWPSSMLTWDVIVLNGYLAINLCIPFYILFCYYRHEKPNQKIYVPFMFLSVAWAFGIHLVTAFLYAGLPARPFWNTGLLGPRFLASAFAAGPAFIIVLLLIVRDRLAFKISSSTIEKLALVTTVAAQANLVMLISEVFKEFYHHTEHSLSAQYLFFGIGEKTGLVPWIWTAVIINLICTIGLSIHPIRRNEKWLIPLCILIFISIWIEKGMGLIIPGFIPSPLGEVVEYTPSLIEWLVTLGIWSFGLLILTMLVRVAVAILKGEMLHKIKT